MKKHLIWVFLLSLGTSAYGGWFGFGEKKTPKFVEDSYLDKPATLVASEIGRLSPGDCDKALNATCQKKFSSNCTCSIAVKKVIGGQRNYQFIFNKEKVVGSNSVLVDMDFNASGKVFPVISEVVKDSRAPDYISKLEEVFYGSKTYIALWQMDNGGWALIQGYCPKVQVNDKLVERSSFKECKLVSLKLTLADVPAEIKKNEFKW